MNIVGLVAGVALAAFGLWIIWRIANGFAAATGTFGDRLRAGAQGSATLLGADLVNLGASAMGVLMYMPGLFGDPAIAEALRSVLPPEVFPIILIANGILTQRTRVRRRNGGGDRTL